MRKMESIKKESIMKTSKLLVLGMLVVALAVPAFASQITLIKEIAAGDPATYHVGETVHFECTVANPGNNPNTNTLNSIFDTLPDGSNLWLVEPGVDLPLVQAPGDSHTYFVNYVVDADDVEEISGVLKVVNLLDASGVDSADDNVTGHTEKTATIVVEPDTLVGITADPTGPVLPGSTVDLTVTESNTGNDPLTAVSVVVNDGTSNIATLDASTAIESGDDNDILDVGETWTWNATTNPGPLNSLNDVVINDTTTFTATGTGTDPLDNEVTWPDYDGEQASVTVDVECPEPCIIITKTVDCDVSKVGDIVTYTICIENCGTFDLTNVVVTDDLLGPLSGFPTTLAPEDRLVCLDFDYTIQPGDWPEVVNQAHVSATDDCDDETQITNDSQIVIVDLVQAVLEVSVDCNSVGTVIPGEYAEFIVHLHNDGDVDLSVDVFSNWGICEGTDIVLPAGDSDTCVGSVLVPVDWVDPNICLEVIANWDILDDLGGCLPNEGTVFEEGCCDIGGEQGCTPGYWKNSPGCWECYAPGDSFEAIFGVDVTLRGKGKSTIGAPTLMQALNANGGGINALARHAVAALLNACDGDIDYPMSEGQIIAAVQAAVAVGEPDISELMDELADYNELGCGQSADDAEEPCSEEVVEEPEPV